ncbi:MAG: family 10 glycosylhydrolase [bacterium]|nr:family 10 glycosylhydrolase [bacterium]
MDRTATSLVVLLGVLMSLTANGEWNEHEVRFLNTAVDEIAVPAKLQIVTEPWNRVVAVPYIVYMPEKDRVLMLVGCDYPHHAEVLFSDDHGATWSDPRQILFDDAGKGIDALGVGLTYLGNGTVLFVTGDSRWVSDDFGETWKKLSAIALTCDGKPWYMWDPIWVDRDPDTGNIVRLIETGYTVHKPPEVEEMHQQGHIRFSTDLGKTWTESIKVPQWKGVDEVALIRAANGDLVAAGRTDIPPSKEGEWIDHFEGISVSFSRDDGRTWSVIEKLYDWGRHHPSVVLMSDGRIVMTYVVRKGYVDTPDGLPQFGIEAIVSADNGRTWDLDHKYILHSWAGSRKDENKWWPSSQATSTVLLPDGSLLTAFGTGYRITPTSKQEPRDAGLIQWRLSDAETDDDRTIRDAPVDSDARNVCDPKPRRLSGKALGTIFNNDINNILHAVGTDESAAQVYRRAVDALLDLKPGVLAQNVGFPDPVIYRSDVATSFGKYLEEVSKVVWPDKAPDGQALTLQRLLDAGTDPLTITVEACRERGVPILASYRMNAEDFYQHSWQMSDFGRAHSDCRIEGAGCLDPAIPEVYAHRMAIFREVVEKYDVDGIEMDFRRWYRMVSNPLENHTILTRMVREARAMLDEVAANKGRSRMLLGVRVGPSLDSDPSPFVFPGVEYAEKPVNSSCRELGLDVKTWIDEGIVDYVCPALFMGTLPGMPLTREFAKLAEGTDVGIYPFLPPLSAWMHSTLFDTDRNVALTDDDRALAQYKFDLCTTALKLYADGADGISTFNWWPHLRNANVPNHWTKDNAGAGADAVQTHIYPLLGNRKAIRSYLDAPWALPAEN